MRDELRQLRRMLFGRKSERFIPSDPSQLKLDFEGIAELKEEREYAVLQEKAVRKEPAPRIKRLTEDRQRRIFSEHLERCDEIIEPDELPAESKRIGEEITELLEYKPNMPCRMARGSLSGRCLLYLFPAPMPGRRCWRSCS